MFLNIRDQECEEFNDIIYNINACGYAYALEFINGSKAMTYADFSNQIMLGLINKYSRRELIKLAKFIGNDFQTDATIVRSNYWAKVLVDEGIPLSSFIGYNKLEIMNTPTLPRTYGPLEVVKNDDLDDLLEEYGDNLTCTFFHAGKYQMNHARTSPSVLQFLKKN